MLHSIRSVILSRMLPFCIAGTRVARGYNSVRMPIRYAPTQPDDGALRQRLRELAAERRRFGYRRLDEACERCAPLFSSRQCGPSGHCFPMCYGTELVARE